MTQDLKNKSIKIVKQGSLGITFEYQSRDTSVLVISIFSNGNMLVRGESQREKILQISKDIETKFKFE